jgi:hypothetical protein
MIRDLTKSALSLSWALSLLGAEQAIGLLQPGQQSRGDMLAPMTQVAANQLHESMRGLYRTGDNIQRGVVDMAFSLLNPASWINPGTWTSLASMANPGGWAGGSGAAAKGMASMMNPMNWMNPANFMRSMTDAAASVGQALSPNQPSGSAPVANESAAVGWGPMPSDS